MIVEDSDVTVPGLFWAVEGFVYSDSITATCHAELGYPMVIDIKL